MNVYKKLAICTKNVIIQVVANKVSAVKQRYERVMLGVLTNMLDNGNGFKPQLLLNLQTLLFLVFCKPFIEVSKSIPRIRVDTCPQIVGVFVWILKTIAIGDIHPHCLCFIAWFSVVTINQGITKYFYFDTCNQIVGVFVGMLKAISISDSHPHWPCFIAWFSGKYLASSSNQSTLPQTAAHSTKDTPAL